MELPVPLFLLVSEISYHIFIAAPRIRLLTVSVPDWTPSQSTQFVP